MTNTNCLYGLQCPKCKSDGPLRWTGVEAIETYSMLKRAWRRSRREFEQLAGRGAQWGLS